MKKIIVIAATLVLLQLLFVSASFAAPPAQGQGWGRDGGWNNNCGGTCYIVRYGDTLFSIGRRFNVNPWYLAQINHLRNPNWIYAGQRLTIPTGGPCCAPPYPWPAHYQRPYGGGYGRGYDGYGGPDGYGGYGYGYGYGYGADPQYSNDGQYSDYPSYGYGMGVDPQYDEANQFTYYGDYPNYDDGSGMIPQYDQAGQLGYGEYPGYDPNSGN